MDEIYFQSNASDHQRRDIRLVLEENPFNWEWNETALIVGTSTGCNTRDIVVPTIPEDCNVVGCDTNLSMVKFANRHKTRTQMVYVTFNIGEPIEDLNKIQIHVKGAFPYNKIYSFYYLQSIWDQRIAFQNMFTLLKPNGEILVMFLPSDEGVILAVSKLKRTEKWGTYLENVKWFHQGEPPLIPYYQRMLGQIGFQRIACSQMTCKKFFDRGDFKDFVKSLIPKTDEIPTTMRPEFINDLIEVMSNVRYFTEYHGTIILNLNCIVIYAKKVVED